MTRTEIMLLAGAVAIAAGGMWLDLAFGANATARAGALIVIYGVVLVGRAAHVAARGAARNEARFEKLEAAYLDAAAGDGAKVSPAAFQRLAASYVEFRQAHLGLEARLIRAEVAILCFGTLLWGFGDLIVLDGR